MKFFQNKKKKKISELADKIIRQAEKEGGFLKEEGETDHPPENFLRGGLRDENF